MQKAQDQRSGAGLSEEFSTPTLQGAAKERIPKALMLFYISVIFQLLHYVQ